MELNPFLARELRARWRDRRAFVLLLVFAAGLAAMVFLRLQSQFSSYSLERLTPNQRMVAIGHDLFCQLAWMQVLGWLLISPALTASAIAAERERGSLEHLLLCPLSPGRIVSGKLGAALLFAGILLAATLPFSALTFLFGGVSPGEFWTILALQIGTATTGASIGLALSAWQQRSNSALRVAYAFVIGWIFVSGIAALMQIGSLLSVAVAWKWALFWQLFGLFGQTNPLYAAIETTSFNFSSAPLGLFSNPSWQICLGFEALWSLFLVWWASRGVRRPLVEAEWLGRQKKRGKNESDGGLSAFFEVPILGRLGFQNPILTREVRGKFRMRRPGWLVVVAELLLGLIVAGFYLLALYWAWFEPSSREVIWWVICTVALIVLMLCCAVMGANGFAREREKGTWEGLRLCLLRPAEIVRGKIGGSLLTCLLFAALPLWPLLLPCISLGPTTDNSFGVTQTHNYGVSPAQALATVLIFVGTAWSHTLFGLWVSWRCAKTAVAVGWTLGSLFGLYVLMPVFLAFASRPGLDLATLWGLTNPVAALLMIGEPPHYGSALATGWPFLAVALGSGLLLNFLLVSAMENEV